MRNVPLAADAGRVFVDPASTILTVLFPVPILTNEDVFLALVAILQYHPFLSACYADDYVVCNA